MTEIGGKTIRIATRASPLALAQARQVAAALKAPTELVPIKTLGDRTSGAPGDSGGKGMFTRELENALRARQAELAVHSAKDLPAEMPPDLTIAAVPPRQDARDGLVSLTGCDFDGLPPGGRVGTSSLRRSAQALAARGDLTVLPLRGNVQTRLRKLRDGRYDAVILAMAGLRRLGLLEQLGNQVRPLPLVAFVPAAGQGALAVQSLTADQAVRRLAETINHADSAAALRAERAVVARLGADCHAALGVHVWPESGRWHGLGMAAGGEPKRLIRLAVDADSPESLAELLATRLLDAGAAELLASSRHKAGGRP